MSGTYETELIATQQQLVTYQNSLITDDSTGDAKLAPLIVDVVVGRYGSSSVGSLSVSRCADSDSENGSCSTLSNVPKLTGYYSSPSQFPTDEGTSAAYIHHAARTTREEDVFCADDIATALMVHYSRRNHFPCSPVKPPAYFNSDSISRLISDTVLGCDGGELNSLLVTHARKIPLPIEFRREDVHAPTICAVTHNTSVFARLDASSATFAECRACEIMQPHSKSAEIQIREMPPCKPAEVQIRCTNHFTVKLPMSVSKEFAAFRRVAGTSSFYVSTLLTKTESGRLYELVTAQLVTDRDTSMPIMLLYLRVPIKGATCTLGDDNDGNSVVRSSNNLSVTKLHSRHELSCHSVREASPVRLMLSNFIPGDNNPADILLSKRTRDYSQVSETLKPVLFWEGDTTDC